MDKIDGKIVAIVEVNSSKSLFQDLDGISEIELSKANTVDKVSSSFVFNNEIQSSRVNLSDSSSAEISTIHRRDVLVNASFDIELDQNTLSGTNWVSEIIHEAILSIIVIELIITASALFNCKLSKELISGPAED